MAGENDHQDLRKRSIAAGGKDQHREKIISCWTQRTPLGALRVRRWWERAFKKKSYEVRAVVFQFLESTRSGTPRDPWMKGEPTPAWDHGTRGFALLAGGRASSRRKRGHPWNCCFWCWGTWIPASRKGECGWETCTEYHCTPTKVFLRIFTVVETSSDCCNLAQGSSHSIGSRPINRLAQFTEPNLERKGAPASSASWWGPPGRVSVVVWNPWYQKMSFSSSPKGTPHDRCRRTMKNIFCNQTNGIRLRSWKNGWIFFTGDLYSMYVVLQGIGSLPCTRVYIIYVIPFGE